MTPDILDEAKKYLSSDLIYKGSLFLDESDSGICKALSGILPAVLSGFASKTNSSTKETEEVLDIAKSANNTIRTDSDLKSFFTNNSEMLNKGLEIVQSLFGDKLNSIVSSVASFANVKNSSASSLFSMAAPLVASVIGRHASEHNLNSSTLPSFLEKQKPGIINMLPPGLSGITTMLGLRSVMHPTVNRDINNNSRGSIKWLWWLLCLLLAALAIWLLAGKGCNNKKVTAEPVKTDSTEIPITDKVMNTTKGVIDSTGNFIYDIGNEKEIKLNDGTILKVGENSTEAVLFKMLSDPSWTIDTMDKSKNWVVLDRVYFESGKSILTPSSQMQVKNIAAILTNFPNGSIKLGGYTDNTGDAAINQKVSDERAKLVAKELVRLGVKAKQIDEAVGYGPSFPVCEANDSPECRAQNRRVDLKVASK